MDKNFEETYPDNLPPEALIDEVDSTIDTLANVPEANRADNVNNATPEQKQSVAFANLANKKLEKLANLMIGNKEVFTGNDVLHTKLVEQLTPKIYEQVKAEMQREAEAKEADKYINDLSQGDKDISDLIKENANRIKPSGDYKKDIDLVFNMLKTEAGMVYAKETKSPSASQTQTKPAAHYDDPFVKAVFDAAESSKQGPSYY